MGTNPTVDISGRGGPGDRERFGGGKVRTRFELAIWGVKVLSADHYTSALAAAN